LLTESLTSILHTTNGKSIIVFLTDQIEASIQKLNEENTNFGHWFLPYLLSKFSQFHLSNAELRELLT
jgi:hypothetical protein